MIKIILQVVLKIKIYFFMNKKKNMGILNKEVKILLFKVNQLIILILNIMILKII